MRHWVYGVVAAGLLWGAVVGAEEVCVTVDKQLASVSRSDLSRALEVARQRDLVAFERLLQSGRVFPLKGGVRVYVVEYSLWSAYQRIRPEGALGLVYTTLEGVVCR